VIYMPASIISRPIPEADISFDTSTGHKHDGSLARQTQHADLGGITPSDHHIEGRLKLLKEVTWAAAAAPLQIDITGLNGDTEKFWLLIFEHEMNPWRTRIRFNNDSSTVYGYRLLEALDAYSCSYVSGQAQIHLHETHYGFYAMIIQAHRDYNPGYSHFIQILPCGEVGSRFYTGFAYYNDGQVANLTQINIIFPEGTPGAGRARVYQIGG